MRTIPFASIVGAMALAAVFGSSAYATEASWDVDLVYPDASAWNAERERIELALQKIASSRTEPIRRAEDLADVMALVSEARGRAGHMAQIGLLQSLVDTTSLTARERRDQGAALETDVERAVSFLEPTVLSIERTKLARWLRQSPKLATQARRVNRILRLANHAPAPGSEALGAELTRASRAAYEFYESLIGADFAWPAASGRHKRLDLGAFRELRRSNNTSERREAYRKFLTFFGKLRDPFAVALTRRIEADLAGARFRKLDNSVDVLLVLQDAAPPNAFRTMLKEIAEAAPLTARAAHALGRVHGISRFTLADFSATPPGPASNYSLDQSRELALKAVAPFGSAYARSMRERLDAPWLHHQPLPRKASAGGVFWQVGGGRPHGVINFRGDFVSSRTLCGAAVLMMGYASISPTSPPDRREEDFPIFGNTLWYLGQLLHDDEALKQAGLEERIAVLSQMLTRVVTQVFENAAITDFEATISDRIRNGTVPDGQSVSRAFRESLERYYSADIEIPPHFSDAWIPDQTLFYGAHHASWALAMSTALALQARVHDGDEAAINAVRDGMGRSATHFSADVLSEAQMNLEDPATYRSAMRQIGKLIARLEEALDKRDRGQGTK